MRDWDARERIRVPTKGHMEDVLSSRQEVEAQMGTGDFSFFFCFTLFLHVGSVQVQGK